MHLPEKNSLPRESAGDSEAQIEARSIAQPRREKLRAGKPFLECAYFRAKIATSLFIGTAPRWQACWESPEPAPPLISAQALVETGKGTRHSHCSQSTAPGVAPCHQSLEKKKELGVQGVFKLLVSWLHYCVDFGFLVFVSFCFYLKEKASICSSGRSLLHLESMGDAQWMPH